MGIWKNTTLGILILLTTAAVLNAGPVIDEPTIKTLPKGFRKFKTAHYNIYTDWDIQDIYLAQTRIECNYRSFRKLALKLYCKMPPKCNLYLFTHQEDYINAGAIENTSGCYLAIHKIKRRKRGKKIIEKRKLTKVWLMAWQSNKCFSTLQHEAFHQFACWAFPKIPLWLNEGFAEYYGKAQWTGSSLLEGNVKLADMMAVRVALLKKNGFAPMASFLKITDAQWKQAIMRADYINYLQAWSIVHYFMHGADKQTNKNFMRFIQKLLKGKPADKAWKNSFKQPITEVEKAYKQWWLTKAGKPTDINAVACGQIFTNFLGRQMLNGYSADGFKKFIEDGKSGKLFFDSTKAKKEYLPDDLLQWALNNYGRQNGVYTLEPNHDKKPGIRLKLKNGTQYIFTYTPNSVGGYITTKKAGL